MSGLRIGLQLMDGLMQRWTKETVKDEGDYSKAVHMYVFC